MNKNITNSTKTTIFHKGMKTMLIFVSVLLTCLLFLYLLLLTWSPGEPTPFTDDNGLPIQGSISEKIHVNINGVEQGMFIKGKDQSNPVLLFLHGGPGMPEYWLSQDYPNDLEDYFTVVWWDQRGSGLSYSSELSADTLTVEQMIADTLAVTEYLRDRFNQEKIYLMAHSGGSFYGIQAAARAPEYYHAYIGMAQMSYQLQSEILAYDYMMQEFQESGNSAMIKKLEEAKPSIPGPLPRSYLMLRDKAMHSLGIGTTHEMKSVFTGIFLPSLRFNEYTLAEKVGLWRGKIFSSNILRETIFAIDLTQQVRELEIPVYFFHGIYDYTCSYTLAKEYFEQIKAPIKGFYTFNQSAHSPLFEQPELVEKIIQADVLTGTTSLADQ
ncbi:MAG: alpha/beta hydrolase [Anaerolineaceae bacterium]|nr:alpha/beta hydrolase [Anaerolineaceae bacterium]